MAKKLGFVIGEKSNIKDPTKKGLGFLSKIRSPDPKAASFPLLRGVGSLPISVEVAIISSFLVEESIGFVT